MASPSLNLNSFVFTHIIAHVSFHILKDVDGMPLSMETEAQIPRAFTARQRLELGLNPHCGVNIRTFRGISSLQGLHQMNELELYKGVEAMNTALTSAMLGHSN